MDYLNRPKSLLKIMRAHSRGWSYSDWLITGLTDENYKEYLSTRDYCSLHPLNETYSSWIDDKLVLKYILSGTAAGFLMPDYYFQLCGDGRVIPLMDVQPKYANKGIEGVVELLKAKTLLALKLIKGSLGKGFYKVEYRDNSISVNGEIVDVTQFKTFLNSLAGYIVCEYLMPHKEIAKYCDKSVGCLRYVIGRLKSGEILPIYSFMRFGTRKSQFVENYNSGGVLVVVKDGKYTYGNIIDEQSGRNLKIKEHPDNGMPLHGIIPFWDEIVKAANTIAQVMPQLSYLGIDFCITNENKVKIIEINSLTSLDCIQTEKSIYSRAGGEFFRERLS